MNDIGSTGGPNFPVDSVEARAYAIPTETKESDGTLEWDSTTVVVVSVTAAGEHGIGYTYGSSAVRDLVQSKLAAVLEGRDVLMVGACWDAMVRSVRNVGWPGVAAQAISAADIALWDLKARLLDIPLVVALDAVHQAVPVYGSGGFCSYSESELVRQLAGWVESGIPRVKMKVGRDPERDDERIKAARGAIGEDTELFVDANGAYGRKQALGCARRFAEYDVRWLEEPVSSDDLDGLRLVRDAGPPAMDVAAGEYGYTPVYFERMLTANAVDCLQADITRCGGFSGFVKVAALCDAHSIDISVHCAPQVSAHGASAAWHLRHLEYFHDHVRVERMLFDGVLDPLGGCMVPDRTRSGLGLELKNTDVERWRV